MESKDPLLKKKPTEGGKKKGKQPISKENEGRIRNRPPNQLSKEDFLQIRVNILERDKIRLEISNISKEIDRNDKTNQILRAQLMEKKKKEQVANKSHDDFVEALKKRTGIDIRNKSIDYLTREVNDLYDV